MNISKRITSCAVAFALGALSWSALAGTPQSATALPRGIEPRVSGLLPLDGNGTQTAERSGVKPLKAPLAASLPGYDAAAAAPRASAPARAASAGPALYGSVVSANSWTPANQSSKTGMYRIPVTQGGTFEAISVGSDAPNASWGGTMAGDTYYSAYAYDGYMTYYYLSSYNPETWERIRRTNTGSKGCMARDLAYDVTTGKTFGCFQKEFGSGYVLGTINLTTCSVSQIRSVTEPYVALAVDADGMLYGIATVSDPLSGAVTGSNLYSIDKNSGASSLIGETGCLPYYNTSAVIDPVTNKMYWAVAQADDTSALYEVNLISGRAVKVCDFPDGEQVCGLWIDTPEADAKAPAAVTGISADFPGGSLSGTVTFTAPSTLFDGSPATGQLNYAVMHGNTVLATGTTTCGAVTTANVTVPQGGNYDLTVKVSNAAGDSPVAHVELYIGKGTPAKPQVTVSYADGMMHVSWTAVTESQNGGYVNPAEVTYRVVRYPSRVVSAEATTATSLDESVDEPDLLSEFYYTVEASYAGGKSGEAESNHVILGANRPPYSCGLNTPESLDFWTVIDANDDRKTWGFQSSDNAAGIGYNRELAMDDWLIAPPLRLEAGKSYRLTFDARTMSTDEETFTVMLGTEPVAAAMTVEVIPATTFKNTSYQQFEGYIVAPASGKYYLGIHACSPANTYRLYVKNLQVEAGEAAAGPGAPTGFYAVPDPNGAYRATLHVTAPVVDANGEPLNTLTKLEIIRGGQTVKTFDRPAPGEELTFTDELGAEGDVEYTAVASNVFGRGRVATTSLFVGVNQPAAPANVNLVETSVPGEVTMTWDGVETDFRGFPLNPSLVTYTIWQLQAETHVVLYDGITGNEFTFRAVEPGDQKMVHYYVSAEAGGKLSPVVDSPLIHCGTPYELPFTETFKGPGTDSWMGISDAGTATWNVYSDRDIDGLQSVTGDNGFLGSRGTAAGDCSSVYTGKIAIPADFRAPGLTFYTYNIYNDGISDDNEIVVSVCDLTAGETAYTPVRTVKVSDLSAAQGWTLAAVPLYAYLGHTIQIDFKTVVVNYPFTFIDDITVGTLTERNLKLAGVEAPASAFANREFTVTAIVENSGIKTVDAYAVALVSGGADVEVVNVTEPLAPAATARIDFHRTFSAMQTDGATYKVEVRLDGDENPADNTSADVTVAFREMPLPVVADLKATYTDDNSPVTLSWSEPATDSYEPLPVTDDFESYEAWAETGVGDWIFVDLDGMPVGKITDVTLPGIEWLAPHSWWVMDNTFEQLNPSFFAASGSKYLAQMYAVSDEQATSAWRCDDWIISPELTGAAQTISFNARSYAQTYLESFEVLWSDGSVDPADFTRVAARNDIPATWSTYTFSLPEGARRFAIRATSYNRFMLFVDDVTFTPLSEKNIHVTGYNVWRDGALLTSVPVTGTGYVDSDEPGVTHASTYVVTTVYDKGESAASNEAIPGWTSLGGIDAAGVTFTAVDGGIIGTGAAGMTVTVTSADGRTIYSATPADNSVLIPLAPGIVIAKAGTATAKLLVK